MHSLVSILCQCFIFERAMSFVQVSPVYCIASGQHIFCCALAQCIGEEQAADPGQASLEPPHSAKAFRLSKADGMLLISP